MRPGNGTTTICEQKGSPSKRSFIRFLLIFNGNVFPRFSLRSEVLRWFPGRTLIMYKTLSGDWSESYS